MGIFYHGAGGGPAAGRHRTLNPGSLPAGRTLAFVDDASGFDWPGWNGPLFGVSYAVLAGKRGGKWYLLTFRKTWIS